MTFFSEIRDLLIELRIRAQGYNRAFALVETNRRVFFANQCLGDSPLSLRDLAEICYLREIFMAKRVCLSDAVSSLTDRKSLEIVRFFFSAEGLPFSPLEVSGTLQSARGLESWEYDMLRENKVAWAIALGEIVEALNKELRHEFFLPEWKVNLETVLWNAGLDEEELEMVSRLSRQSFKRVFFLSGSQEPDFCQGGSCTERASFTIHCSKCLEFEFLCEWHARRAKNDWWGDWLNFTRTCQHKVEMREAHVTELEWLRLD
jgi:hypothetical protein